MDEGQHLALRAPFGPESVGKLPRVTCPDCRDRNKNCPQHKREKCNICGNYIGKHIHLDYVGHADVTDRLLQVDPEWTWEPMGIESSGVPVLDNNGGMWIRLTVAGVTRIGYGHADGKTGGDAIKEAIGDAIKIAAMRFGVALDLWRKEPAQVNDDKTQSKPLESHASTEEKPPQKLSPADEARQQLLNVCTAMELDPPAVAAVYEETHEGKKLKDETNAPLIAAYVIDIRTGKIPYDRIRVLKT